MKNSILVTGKRFVGKGFRAIEPVLEELIQSAQTEIQILAYVFTDSALPILERIEAALQRGVKVTIIVNNLNQQTKKVTDWVNKATKRYSHFEAYNFENNDKGQLHAKVVLIDREKALIGSANFTWGGMFSNHEVAYFVRGKDVWNLSTLVDSLKNKG